MQIQGRLKTFCLTSKVVDMMQNSTGNLKVHIDGADFQDLVS